MIIRYFALSGLIALPLTFTLALTLPSQGQTSGKKPASSQPVKPTPAKTATPADNQEGDQGDQNDLRPLSQADSILSLQGGEKLMAEATEAINGGKYDVAVDKLQQARKIFNQLSNFHLQLAGSFSGIDTKIYESQRGSALKTGQMRDEATYQLALVHRAQNQPELAVPLLIQVIRSQNPSSELGKKSYQQLYEIGFVDAPYNAAPTTAPIQVNPAPSNPAPDNTQPKQ